eukprot:4718439-Amphidinium_carterae.2
MPTENVCLAKSSTKQEQKIDDNRAPRLLLLLPELGHEHVLEFSWRTVVDEAKAIATVPRGQQICESKHLCQRELQCCCIESNLTDQESMHTAQWARSPSPKSLKTL